MTVKLGAAITLYAEFGAVRMAHDAVPAPCSIAPMRLSKHVAAHLRHDEPNLPSSARPAGDENSLVQPDPHEALCLAHPAGLLHGRRLRRFRLAFRRLQLAVLAHDPPRLRDLRQHGPAAGRGVTARSIDRLAQR